MKKGSGLFVSLLINHKLLDVYSSLVPHQTYLVQPELGERLPRDPAVHQLPADFLDYISNITKSPGRDM